MKITVLGSGGGVVTGSCYLVETQQAKVLVDCGLFQGTEDAGGLNCPPLGSSSTKLDAVVLTHAHLDHVGRLPLLAQTGFTGPIFATPATIEMTGLILRDSAKIQSQDAERHPEAARFLSQWIKSGRPGNTPASFLFPSRSGGKLNRRWM